MNYCKQKFIEIFRRLRKHTSLHDNSNELYWKWIHRIRILLKHLGDCARIFHHATLVTYYTENEWFRRQFCLSVEVDGERKSYHWIFVTNHIRNGPLSTEFCWYVFVTAKKDITIEYSSQISLEMNHFDYSFVEIFRCVWKDIPPSNIAIICH